MLIAIRDGFDCDRVLGEGLWSLGIAFCLSKSSLSFNPCYSIIFKKAFSMGHPNFSLFIFFLKNFSKKTFLCCKGPSDKAVSGLQSALTNAIRDGFACDRVLGEGLQSLLGTAYCPSKSSPSFNPCYAIIFKKAF